MMHISQVAPRNYLTRHGISSICTNADNSAPDSSALCYPVGKQPCSCTAGRQHHIQPCLCSAGN
eukprot:5436768-Amphidinium_carterae.1